MTREETREEIIKNNRLLEEEELELRLLGVLKWISTIVQENQYSDKPQKRAFILNRGHWQLTINKVDDE